MPSPLVTRKDIANAAISGQPRKFSRFGGKLRAARVFFYFKTANVATSMPHALGRTPTSWRVVSLSRDGAPGTVYAPLKGDSGAATATENSEIYALGRNAIMLACTTGATWCEVELQ